MINALARRRALGLFMLASAGLGLFGLSQFGSDLTRLPASFQLMLIPTIVAPMLGGAGLFFDPPPRASRWACGLFFLAMVLLTALPLLQLPTLLSFGSYARVLNATISILASLFWIHQFKQIALEAEPQLDFLGMRRSLGLALACSFLVSLWLAWELDIGWSFQLQAAGSVFYGFTGWKIWNSLMAILSLGLVLSGRTLLLLWSFAWIVASALLFFTPASMGMSWTFMIAIPILPAALGVWLWKEGA